MNLKPFIQLIIISMLSFAAHGQNKVGFETMVNLLLANDVDTISSDVLAAQLALDEVWLIDTREPDEYRVSHLPGAICVGYNTFEGKLPDNIGKNEPIVVYCSVGKRSEEISRKLHNLGYTNVVNLWGGIFDWTNKGHQVVDMNGESVNRVHPYNAAWGIWINKSEKVYEP